MISDQAVEAAARATCQVSWKMLDPMQRAAILADTRNLLQAALPVLLEGKAEEIARVIRNGVSGPQFRDEVMKAAHERDIQNAANRIISILTGESE